MPIRLCAYHSPCWGRVEIGWGFDPITNLMPHPGAIKSPTIDTIAPDYQMPDARADFHDQIPRYAPGTAPTGGGGAYTLIGALVLCFAIRSS